MAAFAVLAAVVSVLVYGISPDVFFACCVVSGLLVFFVLLAAYLGSARRSRSTDKTS